ncbi:MAG: diphthamide synthesis protein [Nanoarchaeota archaeon]|nr:diphthamide synthesis protein [Nanoarchaeota archaeon]
MKTLFISIDSKNKPDYNKFVKEINNIPYENIALCYSNQFIEVANKIEKKINKNILNKFQVLGCSNPQFNKKVEAILIIGQGDFHAVSLAYESKLPVYVLEGEKIRKVSNKEIEKLSKKEKGAMLKYLNSDNIGILVTNKPGQERLKRAIEFKNSLKSKKGYLFMSNDINIAEFENFVGIDFWVNTACPRMDLSDAPIINLEKLNF